MNIWKQYNDACASLDMTFEQSKDEVHVKKSYRKLVLKHHPDKGGDAQKFIAIEEANTTIKTYRASIDGYKPRNISSKNPYIHTKMPSFEDIFSDDFHSEDWMYENMDFIFDDAFAEWQNNRSKRNAKAINWAKDSHIDMVITIPEIMEGFQHDISYVRKEACKSCRSGCFNCDLGGYTRNNVRATVHVNSFMLNYEANLEYKHLGDQGRQISKNLIIKLIIDKTDPFQFKTYQNKAPDVVVNYTLYLSKKETSIMIKDLEGKDIKVQLGPKKIKEGAYLRIKNKGIYCYDINNNRSRTDLLVKINLHT